MKRSISRRGFLKAAAAASTVYSILPSSVLGANERVNMACVGVGHRGGSLAQTICKKETTNVVALCDVDMGNKHTQKCIEVFGGAEKFQDFRKMFDKVGKDIDAITVGTPDHSHFPICMLGMSLGKHVYVEKPLAHTFQECELLMKAEKKYGVQCQMGNQGHSSNSYFQFRDWVKAGLITGVTHIDAHFNSKRRWYKWGDLDKFVKEPMPKTMDWDTWLAGRKERPYSEYLHHGNWRGWFEFGNGALGDWGAHILDNLHQFLELGLPERITLLNRGGVKKHVYPLSSTIKFDFPARGKGMPAMDLVWYEGLDNLPPRPKGLSAKRKFGSKGKIIYAKDAVFMGGSKSSTLRYVPEERNKEMAASGKLPVLPRGFSDHYQNFVLACKGEEKTRSPFSVAAPLSQLFVLAVIAQRLGEGALEFDIKTKQITNNPVANAMLKGPKPRKGWEQFYKL